MTRQDFDFVDETIHQEGSQNAALQILRKYSRRGRGNTMALKGLQQTKKQSPKKKPSASALFQPPTPSKVVDRMPTTEPLIIKRRMDVEPVSLLFKKRKLERATEEAGFRGLVNVGNTCYMNCVLQALTSLVTFTSDMELPQLLSADMPKDGVYMALLQLIREMQMSGQDKKTVNPSILKTSVAKSSYRFHGSLQQDAHEFFCNLLDHVHEEVVQYYEMRIQSSLPAKLKLRKTVCPTTKNFSCIVEHELKCDFCSNTTIILELFRHLSLDLPEGTTREGEKDVPDDIPHLQHLVKTFFQDEFFEKTCENCHFSSCLVRRRIRRLPRVLVLHLKRFCIESDGESHHLIKKLDRIHIPPTLDLGFCCTRKTKGALDFTPLNNSSRRGKATMPIPVSKHNSSENQKHVMTDKTNTLWHQILRGESPHEQKTAMEPSSVCQVPASVQENLDPELQRALEESVRDCAAATQSFLPYDSVSQEDRDLELAIAASLADASELEENTINSTLSPPPREGSATPILEVEDSSSDEDEGYTSSEYILQGLVSHLGPSASSGHFVADTLDLFGQQWFHHDDSMVEQVSASTIFCPKKEVETYMLFYVQKEIARSCNKTTS